MCTKLPPPKNSQLKSSRLGYIDAMRGLAMILVVFMHVLLKMRLQLDTTPVGSIIITFYLGIFFFVSGFFAYRSINDWTKDKCKSVLKKKVQAQIIGTAFFYTIFHLYFTGKLTIWLNEGFGWFWFTIVLFQMFIIYLGIAMIAKWLKYDKLVDIALVLLSLILAFFYVRAPYIDFQLWRMLNWTHLCCYFQFFTFGILVRKYNQPFFKLCDNQYFKAIIVVAFILFLILAVGMDLAPVIGSALDNVNKMFIVRYLGLVAVFIFFYNYRDFFEKNNVVTKSMKYIGSRTLDIYLIHVLFLPNLSFLGSYFKEYTMNTILFAFGMTVALIIVGECLLVSLLLRTSPFLQEWLFAQPAAKKQRTPSPLS